MSRVRGRVAAILTAVFAVLGLVIAGAGIASAAPAGLTPVNTFYNANGNGAFLAGQIEASTVRLDANRITWTNLPNLNSYTAECRTAAPSATTGSAAACSDTAGIGGVLVQTTNGGDAFGIAMVWDDERPLVDGLTTCGAGFYTMEAGQDFLPQGHGLQVIPFSHLVPLDQFGGPQCFAPGASQWGAIKESIAGKNVYFESGGSEALATVDAITFGCTDQFFAAAQGVIVASGVNASFLPTGAFADFSSLGLNVRHPKHDVRITADSLPTYVVDATQNGGPPSVHNPAVLTTNPFGGTTAGPSNFTVSVP